MLCIQIWLHQRSSGKIQGGFDTETYCCIMTHTCICAPLYVSRWGFLCVMQVHGKKILKLLQKIFSWLPLATIIDRKVVIVHGGISDRTDFGTIARVDRHKVSYVSVGPNCIKGVESTMVTKIIIHLFTLFFRMHAVCLNTETTPCNQQGRKSEPGQFHRGLWTRPKPATGAFTDPQQLRLSFQAPLPSPLAPQPTHQQPAAQLVFGGGAKEEAENGWV